MLYRPSESRNFRERKSDIMKAYKPESYNSVSPYFVVDGAQQFIDFVKNLFGAEELRRYDTDDGKIMHDEVRIDDSVIMVGDATADYPANQHMMHVYVPNVDEVFTKALSLGCRAVEAPKSRDGDPDRRGMFADSAGNMWAIGTQL